MVGQAFGGGSVLAGRGGDGAVSQATFSVRNFDRFQHYKDRSPVWIKLYNELLDDYAFGLLPDASKMHLVAIWLLASRSANRIPLDPLWVARRISATDPVDLDLLRNAGFILFHDALAECAPAASPEKENKETEDKKEEEQNPLSAAADASRLEPQSVRRINPYPEAFELFWRDYPTDALMSKKRAFVQWKRLGETDRVAARAAIPGFRDYCRKNPTYRPVHAERFLSQRRFDGFTGGEPQLSPEEIAVNKDRADRLLRRGKYAAAPT
jgi:hypothetical protein